MDDERVEGLLANLVVWAGDERAEQAAASRISERWIRVQDEEEATFVSLALSLAERGANVVVTTTAGCSHRGRLIAIGSDFLLTRSGSSTTTFIPTRAVATLRPGPESGQVRPSGERIAPLRTSFLQAMSGLVGERPRVTMVLSQRDDRLTGDMTSVGDDVITVVVPSESRGSVYARLSSVTELSVLGSG